MNDKEQILSTLPEEEGCVPVTPHPSELTTPFTSDGNQKPKAQEIDWSKPIQRRNGKRAVFLEKMRNSVIVLLHEIDDTWVEGSFNFDGRVGYEYESDGDIINVPPEEHKLEGFLNLIKGGGVIKTKDKRNNEDFHDFHGKDRVACIDLSKHNITYTHGQGLEEEAPQ